MDKLRLKCVSFISPGYGKTSLCSIYCNQIDCRFPTKYHTLPTEFWGCHIF